MDRKILSKIKNNTFLNTISNIINVVSPFVVSTQSNYKVLMFIVRFKNIVLRYNISYYDSNQINKKLVLFELNFTRQQDEFPELPGV